MDANIAGNVVPQKNDDHADELLTLSQISPRKCLPHEESHPTPPANNATSPLRSAGKRPAPVCSDGSSRKKSRTSALPAASSTSTSGKTLDARVPRLRSILSSQVSKPSSRLPPPVKTETLPKKAGRGTAPKTSTIRVNKLSDNSVTTMTKSTSASGSICARSTTVVRETPQGDATNRPALSSSLKGKGKASSTSERPERPVSLTISYFWPRSRDRQLISPL